MECREGEFGTGKPGPGDEEWLLADSEVEDNLVVREEARGCLGEPDEAGTSGVVGSTDSELLVPLSHTVSKIHENNKHIHKQWISL